MRGWKVILATLLVLILGVSAAAAVSVNFTAIAANGKPAANAKYKIYYTNGTLAKQGTLDSNGKATLNLPANTTYIAVVTTSQETILDTFSVGAVPVNVTVNATSLYALKVETALSEKVWGVPAPSVNVKLVPASYKNFTYSFATNWTIYTNLANNLTFPNETRTGIWTFKFVNVKVNGKTYNNTTISIPMTGNTTVIAYYKLKYTILRPLYLVLLAGLVGLSLIAVAVVSGKKAKKAIRDRIEDSFRFYRRVR